MEVYVESVDEIPTKIFEQKLTLTKNQEDEMMRKKAGIYFDWAPNTQNCFSSIDTDKKGQINKDSLFKLTKDQKQKPGNRSIGPTLNSAG